MKELISEMVEEDLYTSTEEEEERDFWTGVGTLSFHVASYSKRAKRQRYEIEFTDYTGCVQGLEDTIGIEYAINEGILDVGKLHLGFSYEIKGITVVYTGGEDWYIDDSSEDYYVESVTRIIYPNRFFSAWWWHLVGHRIKNWRIK